MPKLWAVSDALNSFERADESSLRAGIQRGQLTAWVVTGAVTPWKWLSSPPND